MKPDTTARSLKTLAAGAAFLGLATWGAHAQSNSSLLQKLVEKGVLTKDEAKALEEESKNDFKKAYQVKTGMPEWVNSLKIGGDFRARYEAFHADEPLFGDRDSRHRFRYRLRVGAVATLKDHFEVGLRLASGEQQTGFSTGDPISTNTSFQDNASKKLIYVDLAYGKWSRTFGDFTPLLTVGKMENPFVFSDMLFDPDYTPEGFGQRLTYELSDQHKLALHTGQFILDEASGDSNDPYLLGAQLRVDSTWSKKIATSFGIGMVGIMNEEVLTSASVPNIQRGNTRDGGGALVYNYNPISVDGAVTFTVEKFACYPGAFPIRLAGDYLYNPAADDDNTGWQVGLTLGRASKKKTWELSYRYRYQEGDTWYEEISDSDWGANYVGVAPTGGTLGYGPGTNIKGHLFKASYAVSDGFLLGMTYFLTDLIEADPGENDNQVGRFQVDAIWKF